MHGLARDVPDTSAATISPGARRYMFALLLGMSTLNYFDRQIINILVEPIKRDLLLSDGQVGLLTGLAFAVFYSVMGLPIARLADRTNRPIIIGVSLLVWSGFTALCGMAGSFVHLLLARIGVGAGEAGGNPPAHSLITDFTTPQNRASALAFFSLGSPLGALIGLGLGAIWAQAFGWRAAFLLAAIPGILIGLLMLVTIRDPRGGALRTPHNPIGMGEAWRQVRGKRTFWWICFGAAMTSVATYGQGAFWSSFFLRTHGGEIKVLAGGLGSLALVGLTLGLVKGVSGVIGVFCGGLLTDRLARRSLRSFCTVPALALALASPTFVLVLIAPGFVSAAALLIVPVFFSSIIFGPSYAAVQTLVTPNARATAAAIELFILTLVGLGLGPVAIGLMSDLFGRWMGSAEGLRWALLMTAPANLLAGFGYWMASRTLTDEIELD